jgi:hypothetical protein
MNVIVGIPCFNEGSTIQALVHECMAAFPDGTRIIVLDNNSTDKTAEFASMAGAEVFRVPEQGKGNVLTYFFTQFTADAYAIIDGDGTYDPKDLRRLFDHLVSCDADMVTGNRMRFENRNAFSKLHFLGNILFSSVLSFLSWQTECDPLSGARVIHSRLLPLSLRSKGFEVEMELTLILKNRKRKSVYLPISYYRRLSDSKSKLRTFRDGWKILSFMVRHFYSAGTG